MTPEERDYNFPPPRPGASAGRMWADDAYGHVSPGVLQMAERFRESVRLGEEAPDFSATGLEGSEFTLSSLRASKHVILLFGSLSDPPCVSNMRATKPSLVDLYERYQAQDVEMVWVYTREAFPGPGVAAHESFEHKVRAARRFRDEEAVPFRIVVDSLDGTTHKRYGSLHNMTFGINKGGVVVYHATNLDSTELSSVIEDLLAWDAIEKDGLVVKKYYSERVRMARAPYSAESALKEKQALERIGGEAYERIKSMSGFDPYTWRRVPPSEGA